MNTMYTRGPFPGHSHSPFQIMRVPATRPFIWLQRGLDDLMHHRGPSLAYGVLVSVLGAVVLVFGAHPYNLATAISGFLLVGPILTAGLCQMSRQRDRGDSTNFNSSLQALDYHRQPLYRFASILLVIAALWFAVSNLVLSLVLDRAVPSVAATMWGDLLAHVTDAQLMSYFTIGGILAAAVFAMSVVAVPMIIDSGASASEAMHTSLRASLRDFPAMIVWSVLILLLVAVGFATMLVGMVVVFPLLGHATWYAYRDLVH